MIIVAGKLHAEAVLRVSPRVVRSHHRETGAAVVILRDDTAAGAR